MAPGKPRETVPNGASLLTTKLAIPQLPPGHLLRPRLMDRISQGVAGRVTLVSAGPGWGKTMLVAAWAASRRPAEPVAWLSLDSFDNDPVLFWSYLAAAVDGTGEVPDGALGALMIRPPVGSEGVRRIILALAELRRPVTLVLDDFGEIDDQQVIRGVRDLIRHPTPLRLVLITRSDPSLHLNRLRVDGDLAEVRADDLAFTESESEAMLVQAGVDLPGNLTRRLLERTEGWAAGLRLATLYAEDHHGDAGQIEQFADADTGVAAYFAEEVLAAMRPERHSFMLRTSVVDRLCADLADVLSGGSGGQRELEALEQANAFVVALGSGRQWFRYHPLLAEVLRHRLFLDDPDLAAELHGRAARWYADHGEAVEAVRHAVRAGDWQLVGDLMVTVAAIRVLSTERQAFAALLAEIPSAAFDSSAELRATAAVRCFMARDYAGFANQAAHARGMLSQRDDASRQSVEAFLCVADMVVSRIAGDVSTLITAATQLLRWLSEPTPAGGRPAVAQYEAPALSNLGVGLVWSALFNEAERPLRVSLGVAADAGAGLVEVNSLGYLALVELERGHLHASHELATRGRNVAESRGWTEHAQVTAIYLSLAQIELEWNDPERAQILLDAGIAAQHNDPEHLSYPALQALQARVWLATGDVDRANQSIHALNVDAHVPDIPPLLRCQLARVNAEVDLASGSARTALDRLDVVLGEGETDRVLRVYRARGLLALGDVAAAEAELASIREESDNPLITAHAWLVTALAADHQRDDHRALTALDRALVAAEQENLRRLFVALGNHRLVAMLGHRLRLPIAGDQTTRDFAAVILDEIDPAERVAVVGSPLPEPLTDREQVVLSHMATLKTNEEIAADLYISINTVKAHARAVYRKLEVPNRRAAVSRARDVGLI